MDGSSRGSLDPGRSHTSAPALRLAGHDDPAHAVPDSSDQKRLASAMLEDARRVLAGLKVDRARLEARLAERGLADPIQIVRGRSALDDAIGRTQAMIAEMDRLLDEAAEL